MDIKEEKKEIRKKIRTLKAEQSKAEKESASEKIAQKLLMLDEISASHTILLYHSLPDEVFTEKLIHYLHSPEGGSKRIILPIVDGEYLTLKEYAPDKLECGYRSIMEPSGGRIIDPAEVEFAVIPGMAFDSGCNRMGRGKGFYDKLLPYMNCRTIGLGFDFQIVDNIPCEEFDKPLDMVVTESSCYSSPL